MTEKKPEGTKTTEKSAEEKTGDAKKSGASLENHFTFMVKTAIVGIILLVALQLAFIGASFINGTSFDNVGMFAFMGVIIAVMTLILVIFGFITVIRAREMNEELEKFKDNAKEKLNRLGEQGSGQLDELQRDSRKKLDKLEELSRKQEAKFKKAIEDIEAKSIDEATKLTNATPHFNDGNKYYKEKNYDAAISAYTKYLLIFRKDAAVHTNLGAAYAGKGDYDRAIEALGKAIELNKNDAMAYNNRGIAYLGNFKHDWAIGDYAKAIVDFSLAIVDFDRAIKLNPNFALAYYNKACAYSLKFGNIKQAKDKKQALEELQMAISLDEKVREIARKDPYTDFKPLWDDPEFKKITGEAKE